MVNGACKMAEPFEGSGAALYRQTAETLRQLAAKIRFDFCRRAKYHLRTRGRSTFAKPGRPFVCWKHGAAGRCHFGLASGLGISDRKDMTFGPRKDQIEQGMRSPPLKGRNGARRPVPAALAERPLRDQTWDLRRDERQWARCAESSHSQDRGSMRKDRVLVSFR